jgi:crotonobetainyl-CoA:carnitine CoA-transferase CaiB-like acyl-CoA transferase
MPAADPSDGAANRAAGWAITANPGPLSGVKVLELATYITAPYATMMLADLGADVLKVEPPRGDPLRRLGRHPSGTSPLFVNTNRGKRSIVRDLKDPAATAEILRLVADADVLVSNWRPSVADRMGLSDDVVLAANPKLIRVYASGFGLTGPRAGAPVFDSVIQAQTGLTEVNSIGDAPRLDGSFVVDKTSALMVCQAVLAALVGRASTGTGERVDISMLDAVAYVNFPDAMANRTFERHRPEMARNPHPSSVRPLATSDGWIVVVPVSAEHVRRALAAVGRPEAADVVLSQAVGIDVTRQFYAELEPVLRSQTSAHWMALLEQADVPAARCLTLDEHLADEQTAANDLYRVVDWPGSDDGPIRHVRYPAIFSSAPPLHPRSGPPILPS